ncbi:ABC transporter permease [Amaricoccus solimangrovi]|uniref:ABC transporter permease subunit n=1 Tax=Amaricoccus solimangrovi TaxID=2589815 RepID=A0A501WDU8_9RHOB|nr:ABC transporter permease subunit [Amaricoccus solimangrovi]TPE48063.1 ABC transporter permease subunit [Amaricoccus solimangrovi]
MTDIDATRDAMPVADKATAPARPSPEIWWTLGGIALFFIVWTLGHLVIGRYLPPPWQVIAAAVTHFFDSRYFVGLGLPPGGYWPHLVSTTYTALLGCAVGAVIGTLTGLGSAHSNVIHQITRPIVAILGTVPILVAAPFFLIWFGVSENSKIILVAFYSAVVLHLYALRAVEHLHPSFAESASTLGAGPWMIFHRVSLPGSVPELFGGLRAALGAAWGLAAITELLGTDRGIGRVIITTWGVQDIASMMGGLLLLALIAVIADALLMLARRAATRWMPEGAL